MEGLSLVFFRPQGIGLPEEVKGASDGRGKKGSDEGSDEALDIDPRDDCPFTLIKKGANDRNVKKTNERQWREAPIGVGWKE